MKFRDKLKFAVRLPFTWASRVIYKTPKIMSDVETIKYIIEHECSIARYGDGELDLMYGASIKFQTADKSLKKRLRQIARDRKNENCLICIPNLLVSQKKLDEMLIEKDAKWWGKHLIATRGLWHRNFRGSLYGDSLLTRFYAQLKNKTRAGDYVKLLKQIWEGADIVIVEGQGSKLGVGNDLFSNAKSIKRILCPSKNAFFKYSEIFDTVVKNTSESDLIVLALGPTATVLSYDLSKADRRALDLGHVDIEYEWYLMGASQQVAVEGKEMSEVDGGDLIDDTEKLENVIAEII